jgi:hypothetical protein
MLVSFFWLQQSYKTPRDIFSNSSMKGPELGDEIPNGKDNPSLSGTNSSHNVSKVPTS